jgi:hypothetical protein
MTDPYQLHERPAMVSPVVVVMLTGWIDAGGAAQMAMATLEDEWDARTIATFDGDTFIDYRARRPVLELRDGVNMQLVWPTIELKAAKDGAGRDVLLLTGHEPDSAWRRFLDAATGLSIDIGARMMVGLGAYPFATPHSRPSRISVSCSSEEVAAGLTYMKNSVDVPAGMQAALERAFAERDVPAIGLWAQVPHYVSASAYPPASVALLTGLGEVTGLSVAAVALREEALRHRARLDEAVAGNTEHVEVLRQLEQAYDEEVASEDGGGAGPGAARGGPGPLYTGDLPSGDELAAELERFLRDQGSG